MPSKASIGKPPVEASTRPTDNVCRYGGEEFAILLPRTKLKDALRVAERARTAIEKLRYMVGDAELHVTCSFGAVEMLPGEEITDFLQRGDVALYKAKAAGRNRVWLDDRTTAKKLDEVLADIDIEVESEDEVEDPNLADETLILVNA